MSFSDLGLKPELLRAVADKGYDTPSPIQIQAIPAVLAGRDVLAGAQTGTLYRDAVQFDQKTNEVIAFDGNGSNLVVGGYQEANNVVDNYGDNTWMGGFTGAVYHVRLYSSVLAATDVATLFANNE